MQKTLCVTSVQLAAAISSTSVVIKSAVRAVTRSGEEERVDERAENRELLVRQILGRDFG